MDTLFERYYEEEYERKCIRNEYGFCFYTVDGPECFIAEFFIAPEHRQTYEGKKLFSKVIEAAKESNCSHITANIHVEPRKMEKATRLARCYLALGFQTFKANNYCLQLMYILKEGES